MGVRRLRSLYMRQRRHRPENFPVISAFPVLGKPLISHFLQIAGTLIISVQQLKKPTNRWILFGKVCNHFREIHSGSCYFLIPPMHETPHDSCTSDKIWYVANHFWCPFMSPWLLLLSINCEENWLGVTLEWVLSLIFSPDSFSSLFWWVRFISMLSTKLTYVLSVSSDSASKQFSSNRYMAERV